jgi:O-antigen ligase
MSKTRFLFWIKVLILLSPIPFGCVGRVWSPLFYLLLLIFSVLAMKQTGSPIQLLYARLLKVVGSLFFIFALFQVIPLPRFLLKMLTPQTLKVLEAFAEDPVTFHSLSLLPFETVGFILRLFVLLFFSYVLAQQELKQEEAYSVFNTMALSVSLQVGFGLVKLALGNTHFFLFFQETREVSFKSLLTGTLANPHHFSFYLELIFPVVVGLLLARSHFLLPHSTRADSLDRLKYQRNRSICYVIVLILMVVGIYLASSKTGLKALGLSGFLLLAGIVFARRSPQLRQRLRWLFLGTTLFVVFMGLQYTRPSFTNPYTGEMAGHSYRQNTVRLVSDFPIFGTGFGTFKFAFLLYDTENGGWLTHAHNDYLEHLTEGGVVGAGLFFLVGAILLFSLFSLWNSRQNPEILGLVLGVLVSVAAAAFHSGFDFALRIPANGFLLAVIVTVGIKLVNYRTRGLPSHDH